MRPREATGFRNLVRFRFPRSLSRLVAQRDLSRERLREASAETQRPSEPAAGEGREIQRERRGNTEVFTGGRLFPATVIHKSAFQTNQNGIQSALQGIEITGLETYTHQLQ